MSYKKFKLKWKNFYNPVQKKTSKSNTALLCTHQDSGSARWSRLAAEASCWTSHSHRCWSRRTQVAGPEGSCSQLFQRQRRCSLDTPGHVPYSCACRCEINRRHIYCTSSCTTNVANVSSQNSKQVPSETWFAQSYSLSYCRRGRSKQPIRCIPPVSSSCLDPHPIIESAWMSL